MIDLRVGQRAACEIAGHVRAKEESAAVVGLTGDTDADIDLLRFGFSAVFQFPFDVRLLTSHLAELVW